MIVICLFFDIKQQIVKKIWEKKINSKYKNYLINIVNIRNKYYLMQCYISKLFIFIHEIKKNEKSKHKKN